MNKLLITVFSSLMVVTEQLSRTNSILKSTIVPSLRIIQIVQRTIHVGSMDIVETIRMVSGLANANSGGMEHCVINKRIVGYK